MASKPSTLPGRLSSGWFALNGGVSSGIAANLIQPNQMAWAINCACRGGWIHPRPGWTKISLNFDGDADAEAAFKNTLFQEASGYVKDSQAGSLISSHGGRQFIANLSNTDTFGVDEITIAGDPNAANLEMAWSCQAENFWILQNNQSKPFIYDGASSFRALPNQIPTGKQTTYWNGRIGVAKGRSYVFGNLVYDASGGGTAPNNYRDSILFFTENLFLAGGGAFNVPVQSGDITGFKPIPSTNPNQANGQGELIVFTTTNAFATNLPVDRLLWQNLQYPAQRVIQLTSGATSQDSIVNVNEDLFYRSLGGISSVAYTVRNQGQWGSRPLSNEMDRILSQDTVDYLAYARAVSFNNRVIMTSSPGISRGHGVFWRYLVPLDFFPISTMGQSSPPAWDGIWTGLNILKIVTVSHFTKERCFAYVLNEQEEIELWEMLPEQKHDFDGETKRRIEWAMESRSMNFGDGFDLKELMSSDFFFDEVSGEVDYSVYYKPDSYGCWIPWEDWSACAKSELCDSDLATLDCSAALPNYKAQYRPQQQLKQPADTFDTIPGQGKLLRTFFELQIRVESTGYSRMKQMRVNAVRKPDLPEMEQYQEPQSYA